MAFLCTQVVRVQLLAASVEDKPGFKAAVASQDPLDTITLRTIEQHGEDREPCTIGIPSLGEPLRHQLESGFKDEAVTGEHLLRPNAGAGSSQASHPQLAVSNLDLSAGSTLECELLPFFGVEGNAFEVVYPFNGRRLLRGCAERSRGSSQQQ